MRELLGAYRDHEDLISIGAYRRGSNRSVDLAIEMQDAMQLFLRQRIDESCTVESAREALQLFAQRCLARAATAANAAASPGSPTTAT